MHYKSGDKYTIKDWYCSSNVKYGNLSKGTLQQPNMYNPGYLSGSLFRDLGTEATETVWNKEVRRRASWALLG